MQNTHTSVEKKQASKPSTGEKEMNALLAAIGEVLFVVLPLLVLAIVFLGRGKTWFSLLASPEWSFGAAVLMGQSLVKFVAGVSHIGAIWERVALVVSGTIVLGLVPSLIVLSLILTSDHPPIQLVVVQIGFFVLGVIIFILLGTIGGVILAEKK